MISRQKEPDLDVHLYRVTATIVPAEPDFVLLTAINHVQHDGLDYIIDVNSSPIIAWKITAFRGSECDVLPITIEGIPALDGKWAIELPDGRIEIPHDAWFESKIELMDYWNKARK